MEMFQTKEKEPISIRTAIAIAGQIIERITVSELLKRIEELKTENEEFKSLVKKVIKKIYNDGYKDGFEQANKMHVELLETITTKQSI